MTAPHPPGDSANDHKLIARINAGDEQAFERLYHRHREWVFRMACRISGSEHLAQDVVQEVFRYFLGKFPGFELRCELRTFLYPAVRNLAVPAASSAGKPARPRSTSSPLLTTRPQDTTTSSRSSPTSARITAKSSCCGSSMA